MRISVDRSSGMTHRGKVATMTSILALVSIVQAVVRLPFFGDPLPVVTLSLWVPVASALYAWVWLQFTQAFWSVSLRRLAPARVAHRPGRI